MTEPQRRLGQTDESTTRGARRMIERLVFGPGLNTLLQREGDLLAKTNIHLATYVFREIPGVFDDHLEAHKRGALLTTAVLRLQGNLPFIFSLSITDWSFEKVATIVEADFFERHLQVLQRHPKLERVLRASSLSNNELDLFVLAGASDVLSILETQQRRYAGDEPTDPPSHLVGAQTIDSYNPDYVIYRAAANLGYPIRIAEEGRKDDLSLAIIYVDRIHSKDQLEELRRHFDFSLIFELLTDIYELKVHRLADIIGEIDSRDGPSEKQREIYTELAERAFITAYQRYMERVARGGLYPVKDYPRETDDELFAQLSTVRKPFTANDVLFAIDHMITERVEQFPHLKPLST